MFLRLNWSCLRCGTYLSRGRDKHTCFFKENRVIPTQEIVIKQYQQTIQLFIEELILITKSRDIHGLINILSNNDNQHYPTFKYYLQLETADSYLKKPALEYRISIGKLKWLVHPQTYFRTYQIIPIENFNTFFSKGELFIENIHQELVIFDATNNIQICIEEVNRNILETKQNQTTHLKRKWIPGKVEPQPNFVVKTITNGSDSEESVGTPILDEPPVPKIKKRKN